MIDLPQKLEPNKKDKNNDKKHKKDKKVMGNGSVSDQSGHGQHVSERLPWIQLASSGTLELGEGAICDLSPEASVLGGDHAHESLC